MSPRPNSIRTWCVLTFLLAGTTAWADPCTWSGADVGSGHVAGSFSENAGTFTVNGSGALTPSDPTDQFYFVYKEIQGDVTLIATLSSLVGTNSARRAGVMIRNELVGDSSYAMTSVKGNGSEYEFMRRLPGDGNPVRTSVTPSSGLPVDLKLVRSGDTVTSSYRETGGNWVVIGTETFDLTTRVYAGMIVASRESSSIATGTFSDVFVDGRCGSTWARHAIDGGQGGADGIRIADNDEDGLLDMASGREQGGQVRLYFHPTPPGDVEQPWEKVQIASTMEGVEDVVTADLDGDGANDAVVSRQDFPTNPLSKRIWVIWAPTATTAYKTPNQWSSMVITSSVGLAWLYAVPLDVEGDGDLDLVAGARDSGAKISWFENPKKPNGDPRIAGTWNRHDMSNAEWAMSIDPYDMDTDGHIDIVVCDRQKTARWLENPSPGSLTGPWTSHDIGTVNASDTTKDAMFCDIGDLDEDGKDDVIVPLSGPSAADNRLYFMRRTNSSGTPSWESRLIDLNPNAHVGTFKSAAVSDIDMDGNRDIVVSFANADGLRSGVGWFSYRTLLTDDTWDYRDISGADGVKFDDVLLLDIDGDGDLDVATTEEKTELGVIWYENPTVP